MADDPKQHDLLADASAGLDLKPNKAGSAGHRQRLRQRFLDGGPDALPDYELLELMLFMAMPRVDTKPIAKDLLRTFGSFAEVISAPPESLKQIKGLGDAGVVALKSAQAAAGRLLRAEVLEKPILSSWDRLLDYCTAIMAYEPKEQFRILFLDKKNRLILDEAQQDGTVDQTPVYPREVVKRALEVNATALIMVHNHPSGDPEPSRADIDMTKRVKDACSGVGIVLHDHVIVSRGGYTSFKADGLLT